MLRITASRIAFGLIAITCASASVQKIGPDLYAYISTNDSSANSTFLIGDKGILVVDTGLNAEEGRKLLEEIRKVSSLPVRWIVNTHYHPDHRGGNSVVGPDAVIISTSFTRGQALRDKQAPDYALNETVEKEGLTLYLGAHEVRVYHPGPAHTRGDLVVYFPDEHILATGDLFLKNSCPAMDDGDLENWIAALDRMLALPVDHVVPGHFDLASTADMRHFRDYLADLRDQVARMHHEGLTLQLVKRNLNLGRYRDMRQFPQYEATFADNAAAYYRQLEARKRSALRQPTTETQRHAAKPSLGRE
jgi:glyoxylase-like metal-dependent hydrolase (beta-lactamase superfamily II)